MVSKPVRLGSRSGGLIDKLGGWVQFAIERRVCPFNGGAIALTSLSLPLFCPAQPEVDSIVTQSG